MVRINRTSDLREPRRARRRFAVLVCVALSACNQEPLFSNVHPDEATEIVAHLQIIGIPASRTENKDGTIELTVPHDDLGRAVASLKEAGYPRQTFSSIEDLFPASGMLTTPFEQRARLTYAVNEEIANTVSRLSGVTDARVHVVPAEEDLRGIVRRKPTAAAMVRYRPETDVADLEVKVRTVLSRSVAGLDYDDVSVVMETDDTRLGQPTVIGPAAAMASGESSDWGFVFLAIGMILGGAIALAAPHFRRRVS